MKFLPFLFFDFITSPFGTVEIDSLVTSLLISEFPFETDEFDLVVTSLLIAEFQFEAVEFDLLVSTLSISDMSSLCCSAVK